MNYTTIEILFAKIISDLDLRDKSPDTSLWVEWSAEALRKIGAVPQFVVRNATVKDAYGTPPILEISNYQSKLPSDFYKELIVGFSADSEEGPFYVITPNTKVADFCQNDYNYSIYHPYIRINNDVGYVKMSYRAMPTDENGFPYIPDTEEMKEAIKWYIEMMMMYQEFRRNKEGGGPKYSNAKAEWAAWKQRAYASIMMPQSEAELNEIASIWLRSVPRWGSMALDNSIRKGSI